jgi:5-amino-6-(5-phosphoribosylamino)uracil reductase
MSAPRPYVVLSCAMSADGYIDDATDRRLLLSNDADFDRVDSERAASDAILVGASTIRRDNPRLLVRSEARRADRARQGLPPSPAKVTVTSSGDLDPAAQFFAAGGPDVPRLVYCPPAALEATVGRLAGTPGTEVVASEPPGLAAVLADLAARGIGRLFAEGGTTIHTQLLAGGLADELHLVVAPFFVGGGGAPRFVGEAAFPFDAAHRMTLASVTQIGDVVLLRYLMRAESATSHPPVAA